MFKKSNKFIHELVHHWKMGKTNFSMHFDTLAIYLTVLEKEQQKKHYKYATFLVTVF